MQSKTKLIDILLDETAREDERDDAAIDLGNFEGNEVVQALFTIAMDISFQSEMVKGSCGESLATIWVRTGEIDFLLLSQLEGAAFREAVAIIKGKRKDWYSQFITLSSLEMIQLSHSDS